MSDKESQPAEQVSIITRVSLGSVGHVFELAETPKGLLEARIDGDPITRKQLKELNQWLKMFKLPKTKGDQE